jgi:hypothetical protein
VVEIVEEGMEKVEDESHLLGKLLVLIFGEYDFGEDILRRGPWSSIILFYCFIYFIYIHFLFLVYYYI